MDPTILAAVISGGAALVGGFVGALGSYTVATRTYRLERAKLMSSWNRSEEVAKGRISAYSELWKCLGGMSTHNRPEDMVQGLEATQRRLQEWYYDHGGGLFLTGAGDDSDSTKAAYFIVRQLQSNNPYEIWEAFHRLRRAIRRDIGIFESETDEQAAVQRAKSTFGTYVR